MINQQYKYLLFTSLLTLCFTFQLDSLYASDDFIPAPLIQLGAESSHHIFIAEKATHTLYLFKKGDGIPSLVNKFVMVSGKKAGDKYFQGDFKTPEGIFTLSKFIPHTTLVKMYGQEAGSIYGSGAFTINYPNTMDRKRGKTGGGIWLHSTNDPARLDKGLDSRGCLVIANNQLKQVSSYIELKKTPIIVTHRLSYLSTDTWKQTQLEINTLLNTWVKAWQAENLKDYLALYSPKFRNRHRGNFSKLAAHKKYIFSLQAHPKIKISNITILQTASYTRISFIQDYHSKLIQDIGRKELYLVYDKNYNLKIIDELWLKHGAPIAQEPFTPKQQYFTPENQGTF